MAYLIVGISPLPGQYISRGLAGKIGVLGVWEYEDVSHMQIVYLEGHLRGNRELSTGNPP